METVKSIILFLYLFAIFIGIAALTITILADSRNKTKVNKALKIFTIGLVVTNFYDFILFYFDYRLLNFPSAFAIRLGCCIIALLSCLWVNLQYEIINDKSTKFMRTTVLTYSLAYAAFWLLVALFFSNVAFNMLRWILLATDIIYILIFALTSVVYMSKAVMANLRSSVNYQLLVTAMIIWNYISFAWGETANNLNIGIAAHVPLDMTIAFWLIVNVATVFFIMKTSFSEAFAGTEPEAMQAEENIANEGERIFEELQEEFALTDRETELCNFIYEGKSNAEIAEKLFITESTVKTHIYNLYRKTGVKSRMEIIRIVREHMS